MSVGRFVVSLLVWAAVAAGSAGEASAAEWFVAVGGVAVKNAVVYNTAKAFRYEDDIQNLKIWNSTIGSNVTSPFQAASSGSMGLEVRNLLVLGTTLPSQAAHPSNRSTGPEAFVDVAAHNHALVSGASAIDAAVAILDVMTDRAGTSRPQGAAFDVGAYEWVPAVTTGDVANRRGVSP